MGHKKYEGLIILSYYDEVAPDEKEALEKHLSSCPRCNAYREKLNALLPWRKPATGTVQEKDLVEARREFRQAVSAEEENFGGRQKVIRFQARRGWQAGFVPAYAAAAAAFVMLLAGAGSGYFIWGQKAGNGLGTVLSEVSSKNSADVAISDVRFQPSEKKSDEVTFSFNLVRCYQMKGSLDDQQVQKVLAYALVNSDNPGVRLRTIGMLDASPKPDREVVNALVKAVRTDDNVGVRREALFSLEKFPFDNTIKEALLGVLQHDQNPGMRVAAINILSGKELNGGRGAGNANAVDPNVLKVLKERSASDQNRYVRLKAADMLKEFKEL